MLRLLLSIVLFVHGFIHVIGFSKALGLTEGTLRSISKPLGMAWLLAALLLMTAAVLQLFQHRAWWMAALAGIVLSQALIIGAWTEARWGTVANILLLLPAIGAFASMRFEQRYHRDVAAAYAGETNDRKLLSESDLLQLPAPVQKYLRYTGAVGRPRPQSVFVVLEGKMRSRKQDWLPFRSEQYNFFGPYKRLFFMKAGFGGLSVPGYHRYADAQASMQVRPLGLIPVVNSKGTELFRAETVTLLNDICVFAPGALVDPRITWTSFDAHSAEAHFINEGVRVSARLYFNEAGELVNFVSDDRYEINSRQQLRFATPLRNYRNFGGYRLASEGEAIWYYPEGAFTYGKMHVRQVRDNLHQRAGVRSSSKALLRNVEATASS